MITTKGNLDLLIKQGATFFLSLDYKDSSGNTIDLPNHTAQLQVRESVESDTILLDISSGTGEIVLNSPSGNISITIVPSETALIDWTTGVYDLKLTNTLDANDIVYPVYGDVSVQQRVTR